MIARPGVRARRGGTWAPAAVFLLGLLALAGPAGAAETQWWTSDSVADYREAEIRGALVRPDGVLALGPRAVSTPAESLTMVWAVAILRDGSVAIAGDQGRIARWTARDGVRPWVRLDAGQVLSLAADGDGLLAGTAPDGVIYRVGARGDTATFARTGERYVWGLAKAGTGAWYAATGTRGRLLRVRRGAVEVALDTDESNLISIAPDGRGGAFAGGDSKGRIVHVAADGDASTVFDAPEDEVRSLARGPDGALYAAALSASPMALEDAEPQGEGEGAQAAPPPGPTVARAPVSGGRATVYRIVPDSTAQAWWSSPQPFVFALAAARDAVVAATGNRSGLYRIERSQGASLWLAVPQPQLTALAVADDGTVFAAASNPAVLWRVGPERAARGEVTSRVFDARRIARWGHVRWHGSAGGGRVELATRSGNVDPPDTTWTRWRTTESQVGSPPARYLQWRVALQGGEPEVETVEVSWRERNLSPRIEDVAVAPQGQGFREGDLVPRQEPVTQTLPSGVRVEYSLPTTGTPRAVRELPVWARGLRTVQWRASDPNGDPLRYRVDVRGSQGGDWRLLAEDLEATAFTWDTQALPDGRYRLRVIATDAPTNPVGEERVDEATSQPFTVDNTPPEIPSLTASARGGAIEVRGRAVDGASPLTRIEVALDEQPWRPVSPEGGFADAPALEFSVTLPNVEPGEHAVGVRAVDRAGNAVTRATRVTVPR